MADELQTYVIRYRTAPSWLVPTVRTIAVVTGLLVVFYGLPFSSASELGPVMEALARLIVIAAICFSSWLISQIAKYDKLFLTKDGLYFPSAFAPDLLFRRKRTWDDIGNILLGVMLLSDRKGTYEYELETAKDKKKLFIYFKSGGHATIELDRMSKESMEKFFRSVESWCIACRRSPQLSAGGGHDVPKLPDKQGMKMEELSFTKMWEEDLHDHFSATNFVPLVKGAPLKGGKLKILMHLASGGLSAVYLAEQSDKVLRVVKEAALPSTTDASRADKARQLFAREAKILCDLSHPQIARVVDFFVENGRDYLVLEFVPGQSLRQLVRKSGALPQEKVLEFAAQITEILDYLHRQEPPVLHRDVTPDNLVLREDGKVVLIDFGAANNLVGTATGTLIGKQSYISPEQFRGKATPQSDIYSLGCTMHFLLTGQDPVPLSESQPSKLVQVIDVELNELVMDCTRTEAEQRIQNAQELSARIEKAMHSDAGSIFKIPDAV